MNTKKIIIILSIAIILATSLISVISASQSVTINIKSDGDWTLGYYGDSQFKEITGTGEKTFKIDGVENTHFGFYVFTLNDKVKVDITKDGENIFEAKDNCIIVNGFLNGTFNHKEGAYKIFKKSINEFKELDTDKNGLLTLDEFTPLDNYLNSHDSTTKSWSKDNIQIYFEQYDKNNDKYVDLIEYYISR